MTVIAKFKCAICEKQRTYKVSKPEHWDSRVVCMACRKKYPKSAREALLAASKYRKVQAMPQEAA